MDPLANMLVNERADVRRRIAEWAERLDMVHALMAREMRGYLRTTRQPGDPQLEGVHGV